MFPKAKVLSRRAQYPTVAPMSLRGALLGARGRQVGRRDYGSREPTEGPRAWPCAKRPGTRGPDPPSAGQSCQLRLSRVPLSCALTLCRLLSQESLKQIHHLCLVTTQPPPRCPLEKVGSLAARAHTGPAEPRGKVHALESGGPARPTWKPLLTFPHPTAQLRG